MPFLGLALLTIDRTQIYNIPAIICWVLLLLPGPLYVHLSWTPRWRLLCMIEDGKNPFFNQEEIEKEYDDLEDSSSKQDLEIISVVEDFESE